MAIDSGSIYSSVRIKLSSLDGDIKGVYARLDQLESKVNTKVSKPTKALTSSFNVMSLAGAAAFLKIGSAAASTLSTYADFEQQMANVASVAGATTGEFDQLTSAAQKAGETTRFTASQAADALYYLSSAGFDASQSIGALDGVLSLAQATGSDLATTSSSMASTISQFGLAAEDAGRVSNVFAAAITSSQANMEKLTAGLRQAGPVAGTLGISLEEVTANLDALYNKGFQGEQAGTALRSIMLDLADSTSSVVQGLAAQGIAYDSINPKMVGLSGAMETLASSGIDLTTIFGKESASQALALVEVAGKASDNLSDLEEKITDTNKAAEAMAIQNDTLKGSLDLLKSESESTGNSFAKDFTPVLRDLIGVAGSLITAIGKFPAPLRVATASLGLVAVAIGGVASAASILGITINATLPVVAAIGLALAGVMTATTLITKHFNENKTVTLELNAATAALKETSDEYNGVQEELKTKAKTLTAAEKTVLEGRKKLLALKMAEEMEALSNAYDKTNASIAKQKDKLGQLKTKISNTNAESEKYRESIEKYAKTQEIANKAVENWKIQTLEGLLKKQRTAEENLTKAETDRLESINGMAQAVVNGTSDISIYKTINIELYNEIMAQVEALKEQEIAIEEDNKKKKEAVVVTQRWKDVLKEVLNLTDISTGANAVSEYTDNITESFNRALEAAKTTGGDVSEVYQDYADEVNSAIEALIMSGEYQQGEDTINSLLALRDSFSKNVTPDTSGYDSEIQKLAELKIKYTEGEEASKRFNLANQGWNTEQIDDYIEKLKEVNGLIDDGSKKQIDWSAIVNNTQSALFSGFSDIGRAIAENNLQWSDLGSVAASALSTTLNGIGSELLAMAGEAKVIALLKASFPGLAGVAALAGSALAYTLAGTVSSFAGNMATGGIVEPTNNGTLVNVAENGSSEVMFNTGPSGQAFIEQMGKQLAAYSGSSGTTVIKLDSKVLATAVTRRQKNGDY